MASRRITRQRAGVLINDENTVGVTSRLTRAKVNALQNENAVAPLAAKQANTVPAPAVAGKKRAVLGAKSSNDTTTTKADTKKEGIDEKLIKKALGAKGVLSTKASATNGVHKTTTRTTSRAPLKATIPEEITEKEAKRSNGGSGVMGPRKRRIVASEASTEASKVAEPAVKATKPAVKADPKQPKPKQEKAVAAAAVRSTMTAVEIISVPEAKEKAKAAPVPKKVVEKPAPQPLADDDDDDPLMVAEYANEIFEYLRSLENTTAPNPDYMDAQEGLHWEQRGILVDWLIEVHQKFHLLPETLYLAINIIDRFLSVKVVMIDRLQLVGITAMFIAAKYEEVFSPHLGHFKYLADDTFTELEILRAERFMLQTLDYNLSYPNPMNFLRRISKATDYDQDTRTVAKYLMEISLVDYRLMEYLPSRVAAAAMYLSRMILKRGSWDPSLVYYSGYTEAQIQPVFFILVEYILRPKHKAFFNKYASKKFSKVSLLAREWAKAKAPLYLSTDR
ncbi:G2/M cyclins accumulate steadily during G2 and are abruptly destroyed at mitosis-like protein [Tirmania nivea]|nr:G2/M cyclins accumulate steadily during G2 and are abruptly destroyed at mitosis-like protein [Tirmania nivea]